MEALLATVRLAARRLLKAPLFAAAVIVTLALSIGSAIAVLAMVDAAILRPLPYADPGRLVALRHAAPGLGVEHGGQSMGTFLHYRARNRVFDDAALYVENAGVSITDAHGDPERVRVVLATPSLFGVLGARAALGRTFTAADGAADAPALVVISHDLWMRRYGGDSRIVGRTIELNRMPREVIGVMPRGFAFPSAETQVWYNMPVAANTADIASLGYEAVARLKRGVGIGEAESDLRELAATLPSAYADVTPQALRTARFRPQVIRLREALVGDARPVLMILLCAAGFMLIVAWANVTNLCLVRAEHHRHAAAIERALGASGAVVARRYLSEAVLLAATGAVLGAVLAAAAITLRPGIAAEQVLRLHEVRFGATEFGLGAVLAVASALLLAAASTAGVRQGMQGAAALRQALGRVTADRRWQRAQQVLAALQVALALTLLVGSGVMLKSVARLTRAPLGFDPARVLVFRVSLPFVAYPTYERAADFQDALVARLRALPGVEGAGAVATLPLTHGAPSLNQTVTLDGTTAGAGAAPAPAVANIATPTYFAAMRIPLLSGRAFQPGDASGDAPGVIVNASLARVLLGGAEPIGRRVQLPTLSGDRRYTIVGVVGDVPGERVADGPASTVYFPAVAAPPRAAAAPPAPASTYPLIATDMSVAVRARVAPTSLASAVRRAVRDLDAKVPVAELRTMGDVVAASMVRSRVATASLLVAAATTFALGIVGLYGVVAYSVAQRAREFGIRLAAGAAPGHLAGMVVYQGAVVAAGGIAAGLVAAVALTRLLRGLLFQVSPGDPAAFAAASGLLLVVALCASYVPARRAARVNPVAILRGE